MRHNYTVLAGTTGLRITVPGQAVNEADGEAGFTGQYVTGITSTQVSKMYYVIGGGAPVEVTKAAATAGTWVSGGIVEHETNLELYEFSIPDECFANGPLWSDYYVVFSDTNNVANIHFHFEIYNRIDKLK